MIHTLTPSTARKVIHTDGEITYEHKVQGTTTELYYIDSGIPKIAIPKNPSLTINLESQDLNMNYDKLNTCTNVKIIYSVGKLTYCEPTDKIFKECSSKITEGSFELYEEEIHLIFNMISSTHLTITAYMNNNTDLTIEKIYCYAIYPSIVTTKNKTSTRPRIKKTEIDFTPISVGTSGKFSVYSNEHMFIAFGNYDYDTDDGGDTGLYCSLDGVNWQHCLYSYPGVEITSGRFSKPYYSNGYWIIYTDNINGDYTLGGYYYSRSGSDWWPTNLIGNDIYSNKYVYYANNIWFIGRYFGTDLSNLTEIKDSEGDSLPFTCVKYANGLWVGGWDTIYTSTNGIDWTKQVLNPDDDSITIYCIKYIKGLWIVGTIWGIYYSTDGINWNQSPINVTYPTFEKIEYKDGLFLAMPGSNYGLYYSYDGMTWTRNTISGQGDGPGDFIANLLPQNLCYIKDRWIAGLNGYLYQSFDGIIWEKTSYSGPSLKNIAYSNTRLLIGSNNTESSGMYYIQIDSCYEPLPVVNRTSVDYQKDIWYYHYANGIFVGGGFQTKGLQYSFDGKTWYDSNIVNYGYIQSIYYANKIWIASSSMYGIFYSTNGTTWTRVLTGDCYYCHYANGIWVACHEKGLYYSYDGITWTQSNITDSVSKSIGHCYYGNNVWVACSDSTDTSLNGIFYSTDGRTWVKTVSNLRVVHCHYANGIWVACSYDNTSANRGLYYSYDGITWTQSDAPKSRFEGCCFNKGIWLAYYNYGIYYSFNGTSWLKSNNNSDTRCVIYINDRWYSYGQDSESLNGDAKLYTRQDLYQSFDGITWGKIITDDIGFASIDAMCKGKGIIILGATGSTSYSACLEKEIIPGYKEVY